MEAFDVVVIGSGPAGEKAANTAAYFKKRVAVIEKLDEVGGAGINTGTIPSKTLRETALTLSGLKARKLHGVDLSLHKEATIENLMHHERNVEENERCRVREGFERLGIKQIHGTASFVDPHTVRVISSNSKDEIRLKAEVIVIATGSSPVRPPEFPFADDRIHDSDEILELKEMPKSLAVIGAGVIGSEYACTFNAIGCDVHLIDGRNSLFPFLDGEVSACLRRVMEHDGILFHFGEKVESCKIPPKGDISLTLTSGKSLNVSGILVCAGRQSNTAELNLEAAGITPGKRGLITVDKHYRTEVPHIYAVGDVIGNPALASTSMEQARVAMCHYCNSDALNALPSILPMGIYTIPEAAMAGETEETLKEKKIDYVVGRTDYSFTARGKIVGETNGFLKLLFSNQDKKLLGVHVVGEQATELVHLGLFAMLAPNGFTLLKDACYNYPTLTELYRYATINAMTNAMAAK